VTRAAVIGAGPSGFYAADQLLRERYHAVVYAVGAPTDNPLGIPGDDRPGSVAATRFVAWYNGHPRHADDAFDLSCSRAVVIGNGNVAIDAARMLVRDPDELALTDIADHAIEAFARASVTEVVVLGRRGPAQAAFTNPELRELGELERADLVVDPAELEPDSHDASPTAQRNVAMLREFARREPAGKSHQIELRFCRSPVEILGDGEGGFDERRGLIRNDGGRVCEEDGTARAGEYAVGWIKRGPSGVIGTNKKCAADTVARLLEDLPLGRLNEPKAPDGEAIETWLRKRVPGVVTWRGWQAIDAHERGRGAPEGRPRIKLVRVPEMLAVAGSQVS